MPPSLLETITIDNYNGIMRMEEISGENTKKRNSFKVYSGRIYREGRIVVVSSNREKKIIGEEIENT